MTSAPSVSLGEDTTSKIIVIAGIPNAGKTTLFNALTGLNSKVANYPGVTVERKVSKLTLDGFENYTVIDLPGTYSLSGGAPEETIAAQYLAGKTTDPAPNVIVCVVDACNLERNLFLAGQLIDCGYPLIIALSMIDMAERRGISIKREVLARELGVPVVAISAHRGGRLQDLENELKKEVAPSNKRFAWCDNGNFLSSSEALGKEILGLSEASTVFGAVQLVGMGVLSGAIGGDARSKPSRASEMIAQLSSDGIDCSSFEVEARYRWIKELLSKSLSVRDVDYRSITDRVDRIATHRIFGPLFFALAMVLMFQAVFSWASFPMDWIDSQLSSIRNFIVGIMSEGLMRSLVADGIIGGVGSVIIFVPQIAILFLLIGLLEESGYLVRAAFIMDRVMRQVGLQGRSFIPLLNSFACAVPGIMSTRTIPSYADRMVTILVAPLMSCSARLPIYALLIAAFIPSVTVAGVFSLQGLVLLGMYAIGVIGAALAALLFRKTMLRGLPSHFVMEMPPYRIPRIRNVLREVLDRVIVFIKSAGSVIMVCSMVLWFLSSFPRSESLNPQDAVKTSYAGQFGHAIEPLIEPLGYDWKIGVSLLASFAAREVFVSSIALVNNLEDADENSESLMSAIRDSKNPETGKPSYTLATALSLMVFYVFACQCMSTLAVVKRETGTWRWPVFMFVYMTAMAYGAAFITYQVSHHFFDS